MTFQFILRLDNLNIFLQNCEFSKKLVKKKKNLITKIKIIDNFGIQYKRKDLRKILRIFVTKLTISFLILKIL